MPQFELNSGPSKPNRLSWFESLDSFTQGYVEAMFFTNCDCGREDHEDIANELGVTRLTKASRKDIEEDCADFQHYNADLLKLAYEREYDDEQAGRDFWFTRQGHGVGFWDRQQLDANGLGRELTSMAKAYGEVHSDIYRGWIYLS